MLTRSGSGSFVVTDNSLSLPTHAHPPMPATRPPSALSSCASSRPASAMGGSTLGEQDHS